MTDVSRAPLITAGVKGRFREDRAAPAPGLVPDTTPIPSHEKIITNEPINAAEDPRDRG
jgi:hypothetical protein